MRARLGERVWEKDRACQGRDRSKSVCDTRKNVCHARKSLCSCIQCASRMASSTHRINISLSSTILVRRVGMGEKAMEREGKREKK